MLRAILLALQYACARVTRFSFNVIGGINTALSPIVNGIYTYRNVFLFRYVAA